MPKEGLCKRPVLSWWIRRLNHMGRRFISWGDALQNRASYLIGRAVIDYRRDNALWPLEKESPYERYVKESDYRGEEREDG